MLRWSLVYFILFVISAAYAVSAASGEDAQTPFLIFIGVFALVLLIVCIAGDQLSK